MRTPLSSVLAALAAVLVLFTAACSSGTATVQQADPAKAVQIIDAGKYTVIDVRTPAEYAAGHVQGAENVDVTAGTFEQEVGRLDKDGRYLVYCQSGNRSADAAQKMADLGFTQVVDGGGIVSLQAAGAKIES